jgi:Phytochelatin synthase
MTELPSEQSYLIQQWIKKEGNTLSQSTSTTRPWNTNSNWGSTLVVLAILAVVVVVVLTVSCWKIPSVEPTSHGLDTASYDRIVHTWESELYKRRTQIVPSILGRRSKQDSLEGVGDLIYFNHSQAFDMLRLIKPTRLAQHFYYYQQGWDAQINQAYCGVASAMAVLNSLRGKIVLPQDPVYLPFPWATQTTLIQNECVKQNVYDIDTTENYFWGLGLDLATKLLNCHLQGQGYTAVAHHVDPATATISELRSIFQAALDNEDARLVINYDRGGITQGPMGHGHFSPIGAYNHEQDAFLVMDVAKYKYPPVWVPTSTLMGGIGTMDLCADFTYPDKPIDITHLTADVAELLGCKPLYRGYILITIDEE